MLRWNGWGYNDSGFIVNEKGIAQFTGKRYVFVCSCYVVALSTGVCSRYAVGGQEMPLLRPWMESKVGFDINQTSFSQVCYQPCVLRGCLLDVRFVVVT